MQTTDRVDIAPNSAMGKRIERAMNEAVREAVLRHKRLGESIAIWRDGKVVIVPPEEISENGEA